ncbi:MAG: AI-2E family transporter [Victivallales bacterium]|nr:AI-2E family transporter [Victivallales bacterium]
MKQYLQKKQGWFKSIFDKPAGKAFSSIVNLLHTHQAGDESSNAIISLLKAILWADGPAEEREIEYFEKILERNYTQHQISQLVAELKSPQKIDVKTACSILGNFSEEQKTNLLKSLISLGLADEDYSNKQKKIVANVAASLNIPKKTLEEIEIDIEQNYKAKNRLLKSSAGIIVALIVIGVFILTATLLKSVLFGLILAYIFLPLEKFYERKLENKGIFSAFFRFFACLGKPFKAISKSINRNKVQPDYTNEEIVRRKRQTLIAKASTLTVSSFILIMIFVVTIFFSVSANYLAGVGSSVKSWLKTNISTEQLINPDKKNGTTEGKIEAKNNEELKETKDKISEKPAESSYFRKVVGNLEKLKPKLQNMPLINWCVEQISKMLNDPKTQKELFTTALKKSGGVFSFASGMLSSFVSLLLNTLLAIFFFSLFLSKMAEFIQDSNNQKKLQSEYIVRTVFNNKWLPGATENTISQAQEIITQVINRLKIWLKGYLTLMSFDFVVYTTVFYLLGVPYALVLGLIAACGILLPYIGPIASAILTVLVTLAVGNDVTMMQLLLILCTYATWNGIIEQLFLYPAVIGESLGLTTLETIIVVLLGGIFAGITGMIFAIPTASILKYLIPKIYTCIND